MLRSMYSGISGMKNFQTKLDVIGNNIANVNTFGFKKGRVTFKDAMYQTLSGAAAPGTNVGGVNPKQVGLGSEIATVETIDTESSLQTTGRTLDFAVVGDGYFVVSDGTNDFYTRAGNFYLDKNGTLVTADGHKVLSTTGGSITLSSNYTIASDGTITDGSNQYKIRLVKFSNPTGLDKVGGNLYGETVNSGTPIIPTDGGSIVSGKLEMSNVDLAEEFTEMIVAQRGFQANTRIITTSDEILQELVNLKR